MAILRQILEFIGTHMKKKSRFYQIIYCLRRFAFDLIAITVIFIYSKNLYAQQNNSNNEGNFQNNQIEEILAPDSEQDQKNNEANNLPDNNVEISISKKADNEIKSIMITPEEDQGIELILDSFKTGKELIFNDFDLYDEDTADVNQDELILEEDEINENAFIYLASIIFQSSDQWSIWLNNNKITSSNNNIINEIFIKDVNINYVDILWKLSLSKWRILSGNDDESSTPPNLNNNNQVEIEFTLRPNQTFDLRREAIIEGKKKFN